MWTWQRDAPFFLSVLFWALFHVDVKSLHLSLSSTSHFISWYFLPCMMSPIIIIPSLPLDVCPFHSSFHHNTEQPPWPHHATILLSFPFPLVGWYPPAFSFLQLSISLFLRSQSYIFSIHSLHLHSTPDSVCFFCIRECEPLGSTHHTGNYISQYIEMNWNLRLLFSIIWNQVYIYKKHFSPTHLVKLNTSMHKIQWSHNKYRDRLSVLVKLCLQFCGIEQNTKICTVIYLDEHKSFNFCFPAL